MRLGIFRLMALALGAAIYVSACNKPPAEPKTADTKTVETKAPELKPLPANLAPAPAPLAFFTPTFSESASPAPDVPVGVPNRRVTLALSPNQVYQQTFQVNRKGFLSAVQLVLER